MIVYNTHTSITVRKTFPPQVATTVHRDGTDAVSDHLLQIEEQDLRNLLTIVFESELRAGVIFQICSVSFP